jgi:hypothetical protein
MLYLSICFMCVFHCSLFLVFVCCAVSVVGTCFLIRQVKKQELGYYIIIIIIIIKLFMIDIETKPLHCKAMLTVQEQFTY